MDRQKLTAQSLWGLRMIDMSTWKEMTVDVLDDLDLDPHNVRLELAEGVTEGDIVQDLFSNEKVLTLVDGIAKVGYLTHEIPIVVRRKGRLVVVEGNRRVAALKAIQNPYLAPQFQPQVTRIAANIANRDSLRTINVKVAPNEDQATQLVGAIHTGSQRRAWSPNRQAAFFQAQLNAGKSANDLINQYPTVDVKKFVLRSRFLETFQSADYGNLELKNYVSSRKFPVSTLERLYSNNDFLRIVGLEIDDGDYSIKKSLPEDVLSTLVEKIVRDIKARRIDTRKLNKTTSPDYQDYLGELRDIVNNGNFVPQRERPAHSPGADVADGAATTNRSMPNPGTPAPAQRDTSKPSGSTTEQGEARGAERAGSSAASKQRPSRPSRRIHLDTADLSVPDDFPKSVGLILAELARINLTIFPNATMDLLRTFLEKSIKAYADSQGVDIRAHQNVQGYVYLFHCLKWLQDYLPTVGHRPLAQVVKKLVSGKISGYYLASTDSLNAINHNHKVHAEPEDVRSCWNTMHELMRVILAP